MKARSEISNLPKTVHGGQAWKLKGVEDFSHNLNPFGPPDGIMEIIESAIDEISHYPDDSSLVLKEALSKQFSLDSDNIIIGAGSSDIIRLFPNTFLNSKDKVSIFKPSFAEYSQQCKIVGANIVETMLTEEDDFRINENIHEKIQGLKALYICNPNNPTGRIEPRKKILEIVKECEDNNTLVFLDETLLELVKDCEDISCTKYVKKHKNLVIIGSFTKSFAMPGIRIGYGFADPSLITEMDKVRLTWNVGHIEQTVATELIANRMDHVHKAAKMMFEESKIMNTRLNEIGFPAGKESDSFFYFNSLKDLNIKCLDFQKLMLKNNVMVRDCSSFGNSFEYYIRYSVKDHARNEFFINAVEKSMKELR